MRSRFRCSRLLVALLFAFLFASATASAQSRELGGTVLRAVGARRVPVAATWVTLHRVGTDGAGPLDSMRTDAAGRYRFRYRPSGDSAAVYFASSKWGGVAYFTAPLHARDSGGADTLVLYDTTSGPMPIKVQSRHAIVAAPDSARGRTVVEVFVLANDSTLTLVAGAGDKPTWEVRLPDGALDARLGDSDVAADAVSFDGGRARVFAPLAPGVKRVSVRYRMPVSRAPFALARAGRTDVLEILIEDSRGSATAPGLEESAAAGLDGRVFRRFIARDVPGDAPLSVTAPTPATGALGNVRVAAVAAAIGVAMLMLLASTLLRRGPLLVRRRPPGDPDDIAREIAALDAAFELIESPTADQRADHYQARARLKARLTAALAKRDGLV
jgi:hypothetical protein